MAISINTTKNKNKKGVGGITTTIENGDIENVDLEVLDLIVKKYNFKDRESALRFGLAVLFKGNGKPIGVDGDVLMPSDQLLKKNHDE